MAGSEAASSNARAATDRREKPAPESSLRKLVFVCYGPFDCNSAGHMAGFANALAGMGYAVAACAPGGALETYDFGAPAFACFDIAELARDPEKVLAFDRAFEPRNTLLVCWTPREIVRRAVEPIVTRYGIPYVVHLEDNEEHVANLKLGASKNRPWRKRAVPETVSDPTLLAGFLGQARGVTVIEERLRETVPTGVPTLLLEPGVDLEGFGSELAPARRAAIRQQLGLSPDATVIVYPGNVHRANTEEVATLYSAVTLLRGRGRNVTLVRTGDDTAGAAAVLKKASPGQGIVTLGRVDRGFLVELLKSADLFVQPGRPGPFNDYRLPSKLPEFMAAGRPIVLPATNVGSRLRHGVDAMLLEEGSPEEIASLVEGILSDPTLAARLSTNARAFAMSHYRPDEQARKLEEFLRRVA